MWMGSTWLASGLCLSHDYSQGFSRHLRHPPYTVGYRSCFACREKWTLPSTSVTVCSLWDPTCDLKDSASVASDSKRIFHCQIHSGCTYSKCLQADSSPFPNTVWCDSPLQCDHTYGTDLVENFELMFGGYSGFQVAVRGWCSWNSLFWIWQTPRDSVGILQHFPLGGHVHKVPAEAVAVSASPAALVSQRCCGCSSNLISLKTISGVIAAAHALAQLALRPSESLDA